MEFLEDTRSQLFQRALIPLGPLLEQNSQVLLFGLAHDALILVLRARNPQKRFSLLSFGGFHSGFPPPLSERIEPLSGGVVLRRWKLAAALILFKVPCVVAKQPEEPIALTLVVCDKVGLDDSTRLQAKGEVIRILRRAGIDANWIDSKSRSSTTTFDPDSLESCELPSLTDKLILMVITPHEPKGWPSSIMGLAPPPTDTHRLRAYVLYNRVKDFLGSYRPQEKQKSDMGTVLGNLLAHELGHLLMPGQGHSPDGLMRGDWGHREVLEAVAGRLLFGSDQAKFIRKQLTAK